jgi:outer membrane lipoprotein
MLGALCLEVIFTMPRILLLFVVLALTACATVPKELQVGGPFAPVTPRGAQTGNHDGERVRWGGVIIQTTTQSDQTCFEVMGLSLDGGNAQPQANDQSQGRFIACAKGFYEPTLYAAGREVTFTGRIDGTEKQKVGEYDYRFPRLIVDAVHLWPKRSNVIYVPYYDPFWDPFWPYYYHPYRHR